jgi:hypothetical protein
MIASIADYSSAHYNLLQSVEDANERAGAGLALANLKCIVTPIFRKYGASELWGISLLHKHWTVGEAAFPGERSDGQNSTLYCTSPTAIAQKHLYGPSVFQLTPTQLLPLEYSRLPYAVHAYKKLLTIPDFIAELTYALHRSGMSEYFGISALKPLPKTSYWHLEKTYADPASVISEQLATTALANDSIETMWCLNEDAATMYCRLRCERNLADAHVEIHHWFS